jgi:hypothetical protein
MGQLRKIYTLDRTKVVHVLVPYVVIIQAWSGFSIMDIGKKECMTMHYPIEFVPPVTTIRFTFSPKNGVILQTKEPNACPRP